MQINGAGLDNQPSGLPTGQSRFWSTWPVFPFVCRFGNVSVCFSFESCSSVSKRCAMAQEQQLTCENQLLAHLPQDELTRLQARLEKVQLALHDALLERSQPIRYVYFPCTAVGSALAQMANGTAVEAGTIGKEGMVGIPVLLGVDTGVETTVCQVAGEALRMSAAEFRQAIKQSDALRLVMQRYVQAYLSQVSQSVACNRLHSVEERFARWMLMTEDRAGSSEFRLTQEFIAQMLGVHRPTVSLVANTFQRAGLIEYKRGLIKILNRPGLEKAACECYRIVKDQYDRLMA
jgi:CRP-like cAMP-binding protein